MKTDGGIACFNSGFIESSFVVYIFDTNGFAVLKSELSQMYVRSYDMYIIAICCESVFSVITLPNTIKQDNTKLDNNRKFLYPQNTCYAVKSPGGLCGYPNMVVWL